MKAKYESKENVHQRVAGRRVTLRHWSLRAQIRLVQNKQSSIIKTSSPFCLLTNLLPATYKTLQLLRLRWPSQNIIIGCPWIEQDGIFNNAHRWRGTANAEHTEERSCKFSAPPAKAWQEFAALTATTTNGTLAAFFFIKPPDLGHHIKNLLCRLCEIPCACAVHQLSEITYVALCRILRLAFGNPWSLQ